MAALPSASAFACQVCDQLFDLPNLAAGTAAFCPRCAEHVSTAKPRAVEQALAFAASALALLLCATLYPFLGFAKSGQVVSMTLLDSATSLFFYDQPLLAIVVFVLMFAGPLCLLVALIGLLALLHTLTSTNSAQKHRWARWLPWLARAVDLLRHWNMVEVFLIGALVSIAKISSMASIALGVAFWCFIGFAVCTVASLACLDRVQLWRQIRTTLDSCHAHVAKG